MMRFRDGPYLVSEVAEQMKVSEETVRLAIRRGDLRAQPRRGMTRPLYVKQEDIDRWKEAMFS